MVFDKLTQTTCFSIGKAFLADTKAEKSSRLRPGNLHIRGQSSKYYLPISLITYVTTSLQTNSSLSSASGTAVVVPPVFSTTGIMSGIGALRLRVSVLKTGSVQAKTLLFPTSRIRGCRRLNLVTHAGGCSANASSCPLVFPL